MVLGVDCGMLECDSHEICDEEISGRKRTHDVLEVMKGIVLYGHYFGWYIQGSSKYSNEEQ